MILEKDFSWRTVADGSVCLANHQGTRKVTLLSNKLQRVSANGEHLTYPRTRKEAGNWCTEVNPGESSQGNTWVPYPGPLVL